MNTIAKFDISDSFKITGRGLVIAGDILQGTITTENHITVKIKTDELKLKIKGINFLDKRIDKISKIALTFHYENIEQQVKLENSRIEKQIASITEN